MTASSTHRRSENPTSSERDAKAPQRRVRSVVVCGASVRSLAESAFQSGFRPLCIDFFGDADLRALLKRRRSRMVATLETFSKLPENLYRVRSNVPLVWAGGLENHLSILRQIELSRPLIGPKLDVVEKVRNPFVLAQLLTRAGLQTPEISTSGHESDRLWLRKSKAGSGGLGVELSKTASPLPSRNAAGNEYFQEYIDGIPMSATFIGSATSCRLIGIALQFSGWPGLGASGFQYCGNAGPVDIPERIEKEIRTAGQTVHALGLHGVFGLDFILRKGRIWFLEVNPRIPGSHLIHEQTQSDLNLFREHLSALGWRDANDANRRSTRQPAQLALRGIIWTRRGNVSSAGFTEADWRVSDSMRFADIPDTPEQITVGTPLCSVEVTAESREHLNDQLRQLAKHGRFRKLCDWPAFAETLGSFWKRFESNLFEDRRRQSPPRLR